MTEDKIKIIAVVKFNSSEAIVLNRAPKFNYYKKNNLMWGVEFGFYKCYERDGSWPDAFGKRKFEIKLNNGEIEKCYGQWWDAGYDTLGKNESKRLGINVEFGHCTYSTIDRLKNCYVFTGCQVIPEFYDQLRSEYKGNVYDYDEYRKIISFEDMQSKNFHRNWKLEKAKKSLINEVKRISLENKQLKST